MEPKRIGIAEIKKRLERGEPILFIDSRSQHAWNDSGVKIPGAVRIHYSELPQRINELPHDRLIVTYCT